MIEKTLFLFGPDGNQVTANLLPVYSGAYIPVYPIGLDMDWNSNAVAYGYSYCNPGCSSIYRGFWLTFAADQSLYPNDPQGQSDAHFPTFFGTRVISSDSGGNLFIQPNVPEAPFTSSYEGWLDDPTVSLLRAAVAQTGRMVAIEWSDGTNSGIVVGQHQGAVPSDVTDLCNLPVATESGNVSFSPDGTLIAWSDSGGVKVAGVPNLAAATQDCTLTSPVRVLSATGHSSDFGGADVGAILRTGGTGTGGTGTGGDGPATGGTPLDARVRGRPTWRTFVNGDLALRVTVGAAGRVDGSARVPRRVARRLGIGAGASNAVSAYVSGGGFAAARAVVVARGRKTAQRAGTVTLKLRPTRAAKRAGRRLRGVRLAIKVSQATARDSLSVKLR